MPLSSDPELLKNQSGWNRTRNRQELTGLHETIALTSTDQDVRATIAEPMAENETRPTDASVEDYIASRATRDLVVGSVAEVRRRYGQDDGA